jgi:hypothetical protein
MDPILDTCDELSERCSDRQAMIDALFDTKNRKSVLGTYDIDENGDTTLTDYGVYRIENGQLVFDQTVAATRREAAPSRPRAVPGSSSSAPTHGDGTDQAGPSRSLPRRMPLDGRTAPQ